MWTFLVFLSHIFTVVSLNSLTAQVGESITFHCSHILAGGNIKYFCRDSCVDKNILIQTKTRENPTRKGRYTINDKGSDFTVTIADLRLSDSGTYICAIDRLLIDAYSYVTLHVIEVSTLTPVPTSASRPPARRTTTDITFYHGADRNVPVTVAPTGVITITIIIIIIIAIIIIIILCIIRRIKKRSVIHEYENGDPSVSTYTALDLKSRSSDLYNTLTPVNPRPAAHPQSSEYENLSPHSETPQ